MYRLAKEASPARTRTHTDASDCPQDDLLREYCATRAQTVALCEPLQIEDYVVQSMPDASPAKWHLAHTTWFFEQFVLKAYEQNFSTFDPTYEHLFNSYYHAVGAMHPRDRRGLLSRPTVAEILDYRRAVDDRLCGVVQTAVGDSQLNALIELGIHHERQHQELLLTDIKHLFSINPLHPRYASSLRCLEQHSAPPLEFTSFDGGVHDIGADGQDFHFDNETPRHEILMAPFALANRLITNSEFLEFVRDDGYQEPKLWLSDGWSQVQLHGWNRPLYWSTDLQSQFTLGGDRSLEPDTPVSHVSFYEADAYARWANARLPTEFEWEIAARPHVPTGNLVTSWHLQPRAARGDGRMEQLYGDAWEWTASPYVAYPGYRIPAGAVGEYNGKFMCNQWVLRGGSCLTADRHVRSTYRNFFYPDARWQCSGIRLARHS